MRLRTFLRLTNLFLTSKRFARLPVLLPLCLLISVAGCNRFHHETHEYVWVSARQMYLHDRVAAVSNHVAQVVDGQKLEVLDRAHRFIKVKTEKNEIGWIEERAVIDQESYSAFAQMVTDHQHDPVVAKGVVRDDVYLHIRPGRDTERFPLLPANDKVELLARASAPKIAPPAFHVAPATTAPKPPDSGTTGSQLSTSAAKPASPNAPAKPAAATQPNRSATQPAQPEPPPVVMEDWWLVRDSQGRTGWLLSGRIDIDVPDDVAQYAEGQRIVSAFVLAKVTDSASDTPDHQVSEWVTALGPPQAGLPFDFDQIRVFTWSTKHHRYETAFRLHPIQGYLPLTITPEDASSGKLPAFSFQIANGPNVTIDAATGITRPVSARTINFQMIDTRVQRIGPDMAPIPTGHVEGEKPKLKTEKGGKAAKTAKKKR
jgi:hypothetical protein